MIVPFETRHLAQVLEIEKETFDRPWSGFHFSRYLDGSDPIGSYVYLEKDEVIAYFLGSVTDGGYYLQNVAVSLRFRRRKIGSKLLDYAVNQLQKKELNRIILEVSASNLPAIKFYETYGFHAVGKEKDYYTKGDDAIVYIREIF